MELEKRIPYAEGVKAQGAATTRGHPALIQDFEPLDSAQPPRWLSSAVKLDSTSAIKKGWTGADVLRGRVFISSIF